MSSQQGFTLLEILVSILIFSIVITTIFISFRTMAEDPDRITNRLSDLAMAKTCLDRMLEDLQSLYCTPEEIYSPPDMDDPPDPYRMVGDTLQTSGNQFGRLRFTSFAHIPFEKVSFPGVAELIYYVRELEDGTHQLLRSDRLPPYPPFESRAVDPILCTNVRALEFRFYDDTGEEFESWDSDSTDFARATPRAIKIQLEIGIGEKSQAFETTVILPVYRGNRG
jgi:general secretion pathway protein J